MCPYKYRNINNYYKALVSFVEIIIEIFNV